jgi:hypothetical protein
MIIHEVRFLFRDMGKGSKLNELWKDFIFWCPWVPLETRPRIGNPELWNLVKDGNRTLIRGGRGIVYQSSKYGTELKVGRRASGKMYLRFRDRIGMFIDKDGNQKTNSRGA